MKRLFPLLLLFSLSAIGQIVLYPGGIPKNATKIKPQAVPSGTTTVTVVDTYLQEIVVNNPTGASITFTLTDMQGTPIKAIGPVTIAAAGGVSSSQYIVVFPMPYWCPGGFTITASGAGLTWYGVWTT